MDEWRDVDVSLLLITQCQVCDFRQHLLEHTDDGACLSQCCDMLVSDIIIVKKMALITAVRSEAPLLLNI